MPSANKTVRAPPLMLIAWEITQRETRHVSHTYTYHQKPKHEHPSQISMDKNSYLATTSCASNQGTLSSSHREEILLAIDIQGSSNANRNGDHANDVLGALAKHCRVGLVLVRQLFQSAAS